MEEEVALRVIICGLIYLHAQAHIIIIMIIINRTNITSQPYEQVQVLDSY